MTGDVITCSPDFGADRFILVSQYSQRLVAQVKEIPGARWVVKQQLWRFPANLVALEGLEQLSRTFSIPFDENAQFQAGVIHHSAATLLRLSAAKDLTGDPTDEFFGRVVAKGFARTADLKPFQIAGIAYTILAKRTFIGDKMGLGKSVEALATIEVLQAYPGIIVCKRTAYGHWENEIEKWVPGRRGKYRLLTWGELSDMPQPAPGEGQPELFPEAQSVIFDESHLAKNRHAKRTRAAARIAKGKEIRLCVTGTPAINQPADLITQLNLIDRLEDVGGFWPFAKKFCAATENRWGWDFSGKSNLDELQRILRSTCMVAREKRGPNGVMNELPDKRYEKIMLKLGTQGRTRYDMARDAFLSWRALMGVASEQEQRTGFLAAEELVKLTALRGLAAEGKVPFIVDWAKDFIEDSDSDEKLVIFAHHHEAIRLLSTGISVRTDDRKPPMVAVLSGAMSGREQKEALEHFRTRARVLVASLMTGGESIDLTVASTVAFAELPWTWAAFEQAGDRVDRHGQKNAMVIYSFIAEDTVDDELLLPIIEDKKDVSVAVTEWARSRRATQ